jgi:hypothetical protein
MRWTTLVVLLMVGCAGPEAEWVGEWDMWLDEVRTPCGGGEPIAFDGPDLWRIENSRERGLFIAGECSVGLRALTASYAEVRPSSCLSSLPDGTPVELTISGGSLTMDADRLGFSGAFSARLETADACLDARAEVVGSRR